MFLFLNVCRHVFLIKYVLKEFDEIIADRKFNLDTNLILFYMNLEQLVRPNILSLSAYSSARGEFKAHAKIFIDANENPFNKLKNNRYPDPLQMELKKKLAQIKKVKPENVFCGNGSDEAIDVLLRIFCEPRKDNIIIMPPTYGIYKVYANIADVQVVEAPLNKNFSLDIKTILGRCNSNSKILFINNPNNPTGNLFVEKDILYLIKNFKGIVVVDEAYIDFAEVSSMISFINECKNLVVLQTFSKAFGMAALRVGTAFASTEIIALMNKIKAPYNVNAYSQKKAISALENISVTKKNIQIIIKEKNKLIEQLSKFAYVERVFESFANYILVRIKNANELYDYLLQHKIVVRNRSTDLHCNNCLRLTVGSVKENKTLIHILKKYKH